MKIYKKQNATCNLIVDKTCMKYTEYNVSSLDERCTWPRVLCFKMEKLSVCFGLFPF